DDSVLPRSARFVCKHGQASDATAVPRGVRLECRELVERFLRFAKLEQRPREAEDDEGVVLILCEIPPCPENTSPQRPVPARAFGHDGIRAADLSLWEVGFHPKVMGKCHGVSATPDSVVKRKELVE